MKKQLVSILFALCMVLCLVPTAAFAEESTETPPECSCETACTAESMNAECPVCGAEGALPENCEKCARPADDAAAQPETALMALIGGSETLTEVSTADELTAAVDSAVDTVKLTGDISISNSLTVKRTVTLDLNGHVLKYESANKGSVIVVEGGGQLTIEDSNTSKPSHRFNPNGKLWVLDEASGTETVTGGVITGGTGKPIQFGSGKYVYHAYYGGGVYIAPGGQLTMTGGNIVGCSAEFGGGICIESERDGKQGQFSMSGGNIIGCSAECGGGVYVDSESNQSPFSMSGGSIIGCVASDIGGGVRASGTFKMSGQAVIRSCTVESATQSIYGGGIYVNSSSSFEMSGEAKIEYCQAISNSSKSSNGGGVYLTNNTKFTLSGNAVIQNCKADNSVTPGETYGGGVSAANVREITLEGNAQIFQCDAANGSGLYITGSQMYPADYGKLLANGGSVEGDVVLGEADNPCTVIGSGRTVFKGKVTVTPGSTIEKGTFNGEVINNGTITGGTFNGTVNNNGTINNGTFNGEVTNNGTINDGTFNTPITGSGTKDDPYQISTAAQLKRFRNIVNGTGGQTQDSGACAVLMNDIVLNDGTFDANGTYTPGSSSKAAEEWTPIGKYTDDNDKTPYTGTFDGQGHTIKGLYVNSASDTCVGLFGYLEGAAVRNLTVDGYVQGIGAAGGIAGYVLNAAIENCSNYCSVFGGSNRNSGGIAGINYNSATIIDCYNVGTIRDSDAVERRGGIAGYNNGTVSNCYNVGTISSSDCGGEIVGANSGTVENCYYLAGTNLYAVCSNDSHGKITKTESKTAAEFADGTVLALLKADRDNSPWDSCQYVATAKITLPVFNGQGDAHDHTWSAWISNGDGTHSRRCTCNAVETVNCSGGKATCKDKAICEICGDSYGSPDPNNHANLKHIDAKAATAAEEGNIEYWHCGDCNKYFSDAAAKTEITQADTVTAKLPQPTTPPTATPTAAPTTAPQAAEQPRRTAQPTVQPTAAPTVQPVSTIPATGDTSSPILWAALLLCSGAGLAVTAYKKNRHRS